MRRHATRSSTASLPGSTPLLLTHQAAVWLRRRRSGHVQGEQGSSPEPLDARSPARGSSAHTRTPGPVIGEATAIRQVASEATPCRTPAPSTNSSNGYARRNNEHRSSRAKDTKGLDPVRQLLQPPVGVAVRVTSAVATGVASRGIAGCLTRPLICSPRGAMTGPNRSSPPWPPPERLYRQRTVDRGRLSGFYFDTRRLPGVTGRSSSGPPVVHREGGVD